LLGETPAHSTPPFAQTTVPELGELASEVSSKQKTRLVHLLALALALALCSAMIGKRALLTEMSINRLHRWYHFPHFEIEKSDVTLSVSLPTKSFATATVYATSWLYRT
jgi:hypothetical protein